MSAFLELIFQIVIQIVLAIPGSFVCWLISGRKVRYKKFWEDGNIDGFAFIGGLLLVAIIMIAYFVF